jgi:hypothetical protein
MFAGDTPAVASGSDEKPILPRNRIKDAWHAHAVYRKLEYDDRDAEATRADIDYQIDGGLPYSVKVMKDNGRGEDANVNFREAKAEDDLAATPFIEMGSISPVLWRVRTSYGSPNDNERWSKIISEKFSKMVRRWKSFNYYRIRLAQQFTRHGVGFAYWEDEFDWRWRADGLSAFKVPRGTESRADAIPYCVCKRQMSVVELYNFIQDEQKAKDDGRWNVLAVRQAILRASSRNNQTFYDYQWEDLERQLKENDTEVGQRAEMVQVYHLWVVEYDDRVSHYIGLRDGIALMDGAFVTIKDGSEKPENMIEDGFLYRHRFRFPKFTSCIIPFFYAIGTHASIHSIRAIGEMNFGSIQISNRTRCTLIDSAKASSMILLRAETPSDVENFAYIQMGGFMVYSGGNSKVEPTAMPDVSARVQPVLNEMQSLRRQLQPMSVTSGVPQQGKSKQPLTKYQVQADQNRGGALTSAMLTMWYDPFDQVGEEMYRRVMNRDLTQADPGGREAFAFRVQCMKLGVPAEAMDFDVCEVTSVRSIGNGSPEQRQYAAEQIWELADALDEPGRKLALKEVLGAIPSVDNDLVEELVGADKPRMPVDDQIARMENALFVLGQQAQVTGEQDHWVHCEDHREMVDEFLKGFQEGQVDGEKIVSVLKPALANMAEHLDYLSKDKTREKEAAQVRKFIQGANGTLEQQENKLIAAMQREQDKMQGGNGAQPSPEAAQKAQLHQAKLEQLQMETQMRQQMMMQKIRNSQIESNARLRQGDIKNAIDISERAAALASQPL